MTQRVLLHEIACEQSERYAVALERVNQAALPHLPGLLDKAGDFPQYPVLLVEDQVLVRIGPAVRQVPDAVAFEMVGHIVGRTVYYVGDVVHHNCVNILPLAEFYFGCEFIPDVETVADFGGSHSVPTIELLVHQFKINDYNAQVIPNSHHNILLKPPQSTCKIMDIIRRVFGMTVENRVDYRRWQYNIKAMLKSVSLPRIKSSDVVPNSLKQSNPPEEEKKDQSFKFKKLKIGDVQQQHNESAIPPLKQRTERSQSVAVGLSKEERQGLKSQRININLMEKKIRNGVYDQSEEVGTDLTALKKECSEETAKIIATNKDTDKLLKMIEEIKSQIAVYNNDTDAVSRVVEERKQKYWAVKNKVEDALFEKSRLLSMIKNRKADNITLLGRVEDGKYQVIRLKKHLEIINRSQLEAFDRDNKVQSTYRSAMVGFQFSAKEIRKKIEQQQAKFQRLTENQIDRDDRKKKMINISSIVVEEENERIFKGKYDKFLANKMFNRFMEDKMHRLLESNQKIEYLFRKITQSYGPFSPTEFASRYFNQQPQKQKIAAEVKQQQAYQTNLQLRQKQLKKLQSELQIEYLALGQQIDNRSPEDKAKTAEITEKSIEADEKLKTIGLWSEKNMKLLEDILLQKHERTQNIRNLSSFQRLTKIMSYVRDALAKKNEN